MKQMQTTASMKQTEDFFDGYAADFDAIYGDNKGWLTSLINKYFRRSMRTRYELCIEHANPIESKLVLDVGCGPGHYSIKLATRGASEVLGIDFAPQMIELAKNKAIEAGVQEQCRFEIQDFFDLDDAKRFDYVILMGFMDYMQDAQSVVDKALSLTDEACFFSFPASGGLLAWQRQLRYRKRCPLYLYSYSQIVRLFSSQPGFRFLIRKIDRDYWVKAYRV